MPEEPTRLDSRFQTSGAETFLRRLADAPFKPADGSAPPETAEAFLSRLEFCANKSSIAAGQTGIVKDVNPERGGDDLRSRRKDSELLQFHLAQAELLAGRVRPEIVQVLKRMQQPAELPPVPAGLWPHALPVETPQHVSPSKKRVAHLEEEQLAVRREQVRKRVQTFRANQKTLK